LDSRRQRPCHADVRFTTQRFGSALKLGSDRFTIPTFSRRRTFVTPSRKMRSLVARIGKRVPPPWIPVGHRGNQQNFAIAVLNVGLMKHDVQHQA
jgi:hypothetical protein